MGADSSELLELYGLVSLVDQRVFGDLSSFRDQFGGIGNPVTLKKLRELVISAAVTNISKECRCTHVS